MTFWAIDKRTEIKIDIRSSVTVYRPGDVICILCKQELLPKYSNIITSHFAHFPESEYCTLMSDNTSETALHLLAKEYLSELLSMECDAKTEQSLGYSNPRPDVLAKYEQLSIAHEIQLSRISSFDLRTRIVNLNKCNVGQNWWLAKSALTPWNKRLVQSIAGFASILEAEDGDALPQPVAEKIIYDGDVPYIARMDYPIIKPEALQSARYYKYIGTNGSFDLCKIIDADGGLIQVQDVFNDKKTTWTYLNPKLGVSIYGKAVQATIHSIIKDDI